MSDIPSLRRRDRERRSGHRHHAVLRLAKLVTERGEQLCRIRDISAGGLMADVRADYAEGIQVSVVLGSGRAASGRVTWVDGDRIGIAFDLAIDPRNFLAADPEEPSRAPRMAIEAEASLCNGGRFRIVQVTNISLGGIHIRFSGSPLDEQLFVTIDGLPVMVGDLRWQWEGKAGIRFHKPLDFETLAAWLAREDRGAG